jgi:beta-lactamase superfamily II metal-dependent hydrolase
LNELIILDVAHGSSSLLISGKFAAVFDAASRDILLGTLKQYEVTTINYLFVSHLDKDHVCGLIPLLTNKNLNIENIVINADSTKTGRENTALLISIQDAIVKRGLKPHRASYPSSNTVGEIIIKTLAPSFLEVMRGPGGQDEHGKKIDSNSSSVVLQLHHQEHPIALFMGDIDQRALDTLLASHQDLSSDVLLFPHHGGHCSSDESESGNKAFAKQLTEQVKPKVTVFSMSRKRFKNPRQEIIQAVKLAAPDTYIACTQLSTNCLKDVPEERDNWEIHLADLPGAGRRDAHSCHGALHLHLNGRNTQYPTSDGPHNRFIQLNIPLALCQQQPSASTS